MHYGKYDSLGKPLFTTATPARLRMMEHKGLLDNGLVALGIGGVVRAYVQEIQIPGVRVDELSPLNQAKLKSYTLDACSEAEVCTYTRSLLPYEVVHAWDGLPVRIQYRSAEEAARAYAKAVLVQPGSRGWLVQALGGALVCRGWGEYADILRAAGVLGTTDGYEPAKPFVVQPKYAPGDRVWLAKPYTPSGEDEKYTDGTVIQVLNGGRCLGLQLCGYKGTGVVDFGVSNIKAWMPGGVRNKLEGHWHIQDVPLHDIARACVVAYDSPACSEKDEPRAIAAENWAAAQLGKDPQLPWGIRNGEVLHGAKYEAAK